MTDQELADKVVALGIARKAINFDHYHLPQQPMFEAVRFVRDWRVAGALMEKMYEDDLIDIIDERDGYDFEFNVDWLKDPRQIIEACVDALGDSDG